MNKLSHLNEAGHVTMVDVTDKHITDRKATAHASIKMQPDTLELIQSGQHKKGDVLACARIAGIMAAKQTSALIPMCHPLMLTSVHIDLTAEHSADFCGIRIVATCTVSGQTGVEMEALTAASISALTLYDMCKAVDRGMVIGPIQLIEKQGGKSGHWQIDND